MNQLLKFSQADFSAVVEQFKRETRFFPSDAELRDAFSRVTSLVPDKAALRRARALLTEERPKLMSALCVELARKFETEPSVNDVVKALEQRGYLPRKRFGGELLALLRAQNADRWASTEATRKLKKIMLVGGDEAMWSALQRLYGLDITETASMLLRVFVMSVQSGKLDYLEVPFLAESLTEKDMQRFAQSLNFKLPGTRRKSRS